MSPEPEPASTPARASGPGPASGPGYRDDGPRVCSIADALDLVGERYSLLVLREIGFGVHRFSDIRHNIGAPRETLATRLRKLEEAGVIQRRRYSEHPPRDEYVYTEAGEALMPVMGMLREWGETFATPYRDGAEAGSDGPASA